MRGRGDGHVSHQSLEKQTYCERRVIKYIKKNVLITMATIQTIPRGE